MMSINLVLALLFSSAATAGGIASRRELAPAKLEPAKRAMRVVLYVTTAGSDQHMSFLQCYPDVIRKQPKLAAMTDVLMYVSENSPGTEESHKRYQELLDRWPVQGKKVVYGQNVGKQGGAMKAMDDGFVNGWFDGYDWLIRINPDVLIYNENRLVSLMEEERNWGVFVTCGNFPKWGGELTDTDFFAVRPARVPKDAFSDWEWRAKVGHVAEAQATKAFEQIYSSGNYSFLKPKPVHVRICHLQDGGVWHAWEDKVCLKSMVDMASHARLASPDDAWQEAWRAHAPQ